MAFGDFLGSVVGIDSGLLLQAAVSVVVFDVASKGRRNSYQLSSV